MKVTLILLLTATCLATPQTQSYSSRDQDLDPYSGDLQSDGVLSGVFGGSGRFPTRSFNDRRVSSFGHDGVIDDSTFSSRRGFGRGPLEFDRGVRIGGGVGVGRGYGLSARNELNEPVPAILRDEREEAPDGSYSFAYESEDGTVREETGTPSEINGAIVKKGSYSFTFPDGSPGEVRYIADENGFRAESNLIPTPPEHAIEQLERAEEERASGIIHDGQYEEEDHIGNDIGSRRFGNTLLGSNRRDLAFTRNRFGFSGNNGLSGHGHRHGSFSGRPVGPFRSFGTTGFGVNGGSSFGSIRNGFRNNGVGRYAGSFQNGFRDNGFGTNVGILRNGFRQNGYGLNGGQFGNGFNNGFNRNFGSFRNGFRKNGFGNVGLLGNGFHDNGFGRNSVFIRNGFRDNGYRGNVGHFGNSFRLNGFGRNGGSFRNRYLGDRSFITRGVGGRVGGTYDNNLGFSSRRLHGSHLNHDTQGYE